MIALDPLAVHEVPGVNVVEGQVTKVRYPFLLGHVDALPAGTTAIIVASDLQGRARPARHGGNEPPLVGSIVAAEAATWIERERGIDPASCGVILPGDYWSYPPTAAKRGGYGDVRPVWDAFADRFRWVVGVPGNHDLFGDPADPAAVGAAWRHNVYLLDGSTCTIDGVLFGGVAGCVGNPRRPFRYEQHVQQNRLLDVMAAGPDCLILHQGPPGDGRARPGAAVVAESLGLVSRPTLVICGHEHWDDRIVRIGNCHVLNAHESVCILTKNPM